MLDAQDSPFLVAEIGGTTLRVGAYEPQSRTLLRTRRAPSPNHLTSAGADVPDQVLAAVHALAQEVLAGSSPAAVSVAYPGPVSAEGLVLAAPTLSGPARGTLGLRAWCEAVWPRVPVTVLNDVTAAGHRYVHEGLHDFCIVTIGSGVGHKVFVGGRPVVGPAARGGELGHLKVDASPDSPRCDCGERGHLGALASGRGVLASLRSAAERDPRGYAASDLGRAGVIPAHLDNTALVTAFRAGDPFVGAVVSTGAGHLGRSLAAAHLLIGTETFLLVGGFALALGEQYRRLVSAAAAASTWDLGQDWDAMVALGYADDDSGLLGAGLAAATVAPAARDVHA